MIGNKVFVYFNLHKRLWSIKDCKTGRIIAHARTVRLNDCTFKVSAKGRARVLAEQRKNVHAGVKGTLIYCDKISRSYTELEKKHDNAVCITYNPYKYETFVIKDIPEKSVSSSDNAYLIIANGKALVYAQGNVR